MVAVRASQEHTVGHYFFGDFTALCENVQSPRAHSGRRLIAAPVGVTGVLINSSNKSEILFLNLQKVYLINSYNKSEFFHLQRVYFNNQLFQ